MEVGAGGIVLEGLTYLKPACVMASSRRHYAVREVMIAVVSIAHPHRSESILRSIWHIDHTLLVQSWSSKQALGAIPSLQTPSMSKQDYTDGIIST